ncbi:hypothetical protein Anapl_04775 [Anas platyrhynchos]|uniref:Uncharacterized protein n=1 Tax=Anas platyrhynchos TaxID=8839 RepID=R0LL56_ANAPL|nr:hypothetical protein Anapl_04775 [Anas platyrhynchos]
MEQFNKMANPVLEYIVQDQICHCMFGVDQGCNEFQKTERISILHNIQMRICTQQEMRSWTSLWGWRARGIHNGVRTLLFTSTNLYADFSCIPPFPGGTRVHSHVAGQETKKTYFYFMFPAVPLEIPGCDSPSCHQMPVFTVREGQQHGRKTSKLSQDLRGAKRVEKLESPTLIKQSQGERRSLKREGVLTSWKAQEKDEGLASVEDRLLRTELAFQWARNAVLNTNLSRFRSLSGFVYGSEAAHGGWGSLHFFMPVLTTGSRSRNTRATFIKYDQLQTSITQTQIFGCDCSLRMRRVSEEQHNLLEGRKCEEHFLHREVNKEAAMNSKTLLLAQVGRRDSRPDLKNKHAFVKIMSAYTREGLTENPMIQEARAEGTLRASERKIAQGIAEKKLSDDSSPASKMLCSSLEGFFVLTLIFSFLNISPGGGEGNADTVLIHFLMEAARISNSDIPPSEPGYSRLVQELERCSLKAHPALRKSPAELRAQRRGVTRMLF